MSDTPDISTFAHFNKPHPILATLPAYLKDPKNYQKVQKAIIEAGATKHSHSDLAEWSACGTCQLKQHERAEMMRRLGFRHPAQYMAWKRIHEEIQSYQRKDWLPKYND